MNALEKVSFGWKALSSVLNEIVNRANELRIIPSATIGVNETPGGVMLTVLPGQTNQDTPQDKGSAGGGGGAGQPPPRIFIDNTQWTSVTVVDPSTCAQTKLLVLAQAASGNTGASISLDYVDTWPDGSWEFKVTQT